MGRARAYITTHGSAERGHWQKEMGYIGFGLVHRRSIALLGHALGFRRLCRVLGRIGAVLVGRRRLWVGLVASPHGSGEREQGNSRGEGPVKRTDKARPAASSTHEGAGCCAVFLVAFAFFFARA